jgi:acyl dehydratase
MAEKKNVVEFKNQAYQVETQSPGLTDESINEAKKLIGVDLRVGRATVEVTRDLIRNYCNMNDCMNPLYLDENYARKSKWGGIIAPPPLVGQIGNAIIDTGLRGVHGYQVGEDWHFYQVVELGDVLVSRSKPIDAIEHHGKTAPRMIEQITKRQIWNQRGELVCDCWFHVMRIPRASGGKGGLSYEPRLHNWTDAELNKFMTDSAAERVRGCTPRYWEETKVGQEMEPIVVGPLRNVDTAFIGGKPASYDNGGSFVYTLLRRREHPADTYVDPVTGAQDHPHRGHYEEYLARQIGMPGRYDGGPTRNSIMARYVADWMGDDAFLQKCWVTLRRPRLVADVVWGNGKVTKKWIEGNDHLVGVETFLANQDGEKNAVSRAVVILPSQANL